MPWRVTDLLEQKRHPYKDMRGLYKAGTAYRSVSWAPLHWSCVTLTIGDHLRKSAVWRSHLSEIRGQQSRSIIANLEVFTTWATQASPLQRHAPTRPVQRTGAFHRLRFIRPA